VELVGFEPPPAAHHSLVAGSSPAGILACGTSRRRFRDGEGHCQQSPDRQFCASANHEMWAVLLQGILLKAQII